MIFENIEIETTADGSATLYRKDIDEHYHSVKGALAESEHVYINLGWRPLTSVKKNIRVFEVGFGTGLNATLTAMAALESKTDTEYLSVELYPLPREITDSLAYNRSADFLDTYKSVNGAAWNEKVEVNPLFSLRKIKGNLLTLDIPADIDVVYFDAFAPEKQPEMWNEAIFRKIFDAMTPGGVLTTYCAKGKIRRMLQQIGFVPERLPGPPEGKREVLRAVKPSEAV